MKVTFDKNVYEFVADPQKQATLSEQVKECYQNIQALILQGRIIPFISETILTYEAIKKTDRQAILSHPQPITVSTANGRITIGSNPGIHPGNSFHDDLYLPKAIQLGFKILPDRRLGKLLNPSVKTEWYYLPDEDFFTTTARFTNVTTVLEELNVGYKVYQSLLEITPALIPLEAIKAYKGHYKKLSAAISERSDGDSVALHIANEIDCFCTKDKGANAGHSVFSPDVCAILSAKFGFEKVSPLELLKKFHS